MVALTYSRHLTAGNQGVDSSYLKIAYEQGILMAIAFMITLLVVLGGLITTAVRTRNPIQSALAVAAVGTLVAFATQLNFEVVYFETPTVLASWILIGIGMRQVVHYRNQAR